MDSDSEKITTLDELRIAAENAAEKAIFKHAHLISQEAKRQIWARGLPYTVLQGNEIVELYPVGGTNARKLGRRKPPTVAGANSSTPKSCSATKPTSTFSGSKTTA